MYEFVYMNSFINLYMKNEFHVYKLMCMNSYIRFLNIQINVYDFIHTNSYIQNRSKKQINLEFTYITYKLMCVNLYKICTNLWIFSLPKERICNKR